VAHAAVRKRQGDAFRARRFGQPAGDPVVQHLLGLSRMQRIKTGLSDESFGDRIDPRIVQHVQATIA
jgi:hypothetical protein